MNALHDQLGRPLRNLRISVTDRCNLRCQYCMPEEEYGWLPKRDVLSFEEITRLARVFTGLGVDRIRLTGGEPLVRRDLPTLVGMLAGLPEVNDLALTTNGVLLKELAGTLKSAGLHRLTISIDTLRPERFLALTRRDNHADVLAGVRAAREAGFTGLKLDTVMMRGVNDDELLPLLGFAREHGAELRFIEYMDVGGATRWSMEKVFSRAQMLARIGEAFGSVEPIVEDSSAPAERFRLPDGTTFGIIASTTQPVCRKCDRSRLTADGMWLLCLYAVSGTNLRDRLRAGASDAELSELIREVWTARNNRGAEQRLQLASRTPLASPLELKQNPHLEMHKRGG